MDKEIQQAQICKITEAILANKQFNLEGIPDWLEKRIYAATVGIVYKLLVNYVELLQGLKILNHELTLDIKEETPPSALIQKMQMDPVNRESLARFVDELLQEKAINITILPDFVERQLYVNCLVILFQTLQCLAKSIHIDLAGGHRLSLDFNTNGLHSGGPNKLRLCIVDESLLDRLVQDHLNSPNNAAVVPDAIEGYIIRNLYMLIVSLLGNLLSDMSASIIGQRIDIAMIPVGESIQTALMERDMAKKFEK